FPSVQAQETFNKSAESEISDSTHIRIKEYKLGKILIEGKTKQVYDLPQNPGLCLLLSKDRITAGDGVKAHDLQGKSEISNTTNGQVFQILNEAGVRTAYVKPAGPKAFIAKKCQMIPIEWVTRRLATGSYLKRNTGVPEGQDEVDIMKKTTVLVFEILEKAWSTRNCALIDMKIEFGIDEEGEIVLADIIDSDSWRLWPAGDKRLMVDKQVYRNLTSVTSADLDVVKSNFVWVSKQLQDIIPKNDHLVVILMGSASDLDHCEKISKQCKALGLNTELRVTSAHKGPEETLRIMREYESVMNNLILITVAGRSNGLGPVLSGSTTYPVINCPPLKAENMPIDVWSSLNLPSGLGCATVLYPEAAALNAAQILGLSNYMIWAKLRVKQLNNFVTLKKADKQVRGVRKA
ncbi:hypothetical protein GQX74_001269, partial [Glossina fuscipes]